MDISNLNKIELLEKCKELGIINCRSKSKLKLIELIKDIQKNTNITTNQIIELNHEYLENVCNDNQYTFIDLFCGIGGFHKGLEDLSCVLACDINKECRYTYEENYKIKPKGDIFDIKIEEIPNHNILCAGFPCQPFSSAGKKDGFADERSKVYEKLISIIEYKQPNIIILENVKNLTIIENGTIFEKIINDLNKINYNVSFSILNVANFGLAQNRERLFIVGINKNFQNKYFCFNQLNLFKNNISLKDIIDTSNKDYIDSSKYILLKNEQITLQKSGLMFCGYIKGNIRTNGALPNTEHLSRVHKQPNRIYHINGVNPTLSSSESSGRYYIYDGIGVRTLTINECYKIMGFDNFKLHEKKNCCYNQIGNSVCPVIIKNIKNELIKQQFIKL